RPPLSFPFLSPPPSFFSLPSFFLLFFSFFPSSLSPLPLFFLFFSSFLSFSSSPPPSFLPSFPFLLLSLFLLPPFFPFLLFL
ncbi:hypothetical protein ACXWRS_11495, partial [Streptococcus pyogenes]